MLTLWLIAVFLNQLGILFCVKYEIKTEILKRLDCSLNTNGCDCPVNGEWSSWSCWGPCTGECGQVGLRERLRECNNPAPSFDGIDCSGPDRTTVECRMPGCSEKEYQLMTKYDPLRHAEYQILKNFHEDGPALRERCLVAECHYSLVKKILQHQADRYWNALHCVKHNTGCPVYGGWSEWGRWSECSAEHGDGKRIRCRTCDSPKPTSLKLSCKGSNCTVEHCQGSSFKKSSRGFWGLWSTWSNCTSSCGQGLRKRVRFCIKEADVTPPFHFQDIPQSTKGSPWSNYKYCNSIRIKRSADQHYLCAGPHVEIEPCYLKSCPVDGEWSEWAPWSQCSSACSIGVQSRSRACSSPPPSGGGRTCCGPYTWIKHCHLGPCQVYQLEVVTFDGTGALYYHKTGRPSRLLHLYIKLKPYGLNGDIVVNTVASDVHTKHEVYIKLSLAAGYLVFSASYGSCELNVVTYQALKKKKWYEILVMVTSFGVTMRVDNCDKLYMASFSCVERLPHFDGEMIVCSNFTGQLQKLYVNFLQRALLTINKPVNEQKYTFPYSVINMIYETTVSSEGRTLDDLTLIPCSDSPQLSIEFVIKTTSRDGLIMMIKHFYSSIYLIVFLEPRRVVLRLVLIDRTYECFQTVDTHVGQWTYIVVDNINSNWGLTVNGGKRKAIRNDNIKTVITCVGYIMLGDVAQVINNLEEKELIEDNGIKDRSAKGILSYVQVNKKIMDLSSLLVIKKRGDSIFSSESISYTQYYEEIELSNGEQLDLACFYSSKHLDKESNVEKFYSTVYGNEDKSIWLRLDTPLIPNDKIRMNHIGITYEITDDGDITLLRSCRYSSQQAIEGFYSCWIAHPLNGSNSIVTYGVTMVDENTVFSSFLKIFLKIMSYSFIMLYTTTLIWILYECYGSFRNRVSLFTTISVVKRLSRTELCEVSHNINLKLIYGLRRKFHNRREFEEKGFTVNVK